MKFFRTHITQSINVGFLLAGLVFYFMKPVSESTTHDAFAAWLQSNLKSESNAFVAQQIKSLHHQDDKLESIIRQASALVKAHADDFELPFNSESQNENEVFQVLLKEWNAFQNATSGMGKAVLIKQANPHSILPVDGMNFSGKSVTQIHTPMLNDSDQNIDPISAPFFNYYLSPLSGGIAIGAP
ncbi:MAG: hypothetical protein WD022_02605 [Balneolaceae bacterium]